MANIIKPKRSNTASAVPTTGQLASGELAVNMADQKVYINNGTSVVQVGSGKLSGLADVAITSPSTGQSLTYNSTTSKWENSTAGAGDVVGPASATDNALVRFDGTTGKLIQNSLGILDDSGNLDVASAKADYFDFDTTVVPADAVARVAWDDGYGTEKVGLKGGNVSLYEGQQLFVRAYNGSGTAMSKGQIVYIIGAQGNRVDVRLAKANAESTSANTIGMVAEAIAAGGEGFVQVSGSIPKLDTSTLTAGQALYLSPTTAGAYTATKPTAPDHLVVLGWVERVSATVGSIYLKVDNGYELDELHNVNISSPTGGQLLAYDQTSGYWKNITLTDGTGISVTETAGGAITVTNTAPDQTVVLTQGGATTITGTYPNFTISSVNTTYGAATSTVPGLIELGSDTQQTVAPNAVTATASRSYALQVNSAGQGVINVPWTDTVYSLPAATATVRGGIELGSDTAQTVAANAVTATASRTYALQINADGQGVVNVPWTDTVYTLPSATTTVLGGVKLGSDTAQTVAANAVSATASRSYAVQVNASGQAVVNVPWTDTNSGGTVTSITAGSFLTGGTITTTGTIAVDATSSNTASKVVARDASGNFSAGIITTAGRQENYGTTTDAGTIAGITGGTSGGTLAAPTQTLSGTSLYRISPLGYTGSAWTGGAKLDFVATENITSTNRGTNAVLWAIAAGGATATSLVWNGSTVIANGTTLTGNTGTVTSVGGTGTVSGLTLTGTVTASGNLTLGGTLSVAPSNFSSQTANTVLAAPNGAAGVPTFRAIVAADIPTLNQNTTGTAANVTGTVAIANGGTGATTAATARTNLGATTVGSNMFTLTNPSAITFPRFNADNTVSTLDAATFRTAIGAGTSSTTGTVTSVGGTGSVAGITLSGTVTTSGNLTLGGTFALPTGQVPGKMIYDTFTATASQTTFTTSTTYTSGKIEVYVNGVKLRNGTDVTVTSGTSVVMATGLAVGSLVDLVYPI